MRVGDDSRTVEMPIPTIAGTALGVDLNESGTTIKQSPSHQTLLAEGLGRGVVNP